MTARTELLPAELAAQLLGNSTDGLMAVDSSFRYTFWNPAMERIYGMPAGDVLGQYAFDLFPFLVETGEDAFFRRALAGEAVTSRNRPYQVHATGRRGHYEGHYYPVRDATGQIAGAMAVIRDVTDQRAAELVLHETENRFKNMADASPVLLWMSRLDGLCTFFNQTWLSFTGRTLEEEWGVGWAEGVHFEDFQRCMDTYIDAFNARKSFEMEYRLQRHDGEYRWILDRGTPRYEADGGFAGFIGSCVEINEIKVAQEQMGRAIAGRDEFLSIASHELRTPLTAAQLKIDSLTKRLEHGPAGNADLVSGRGPSRSRPCGCRRWSRCCWTSRASPWASWRSSPRRWTWPSWRHRWSAGSTTTPATPAARCGWWRRRRWWGAGTGCASSR